MLFNLQFTLNLGKGAQALAWPRTRCGECMLVPQPFDTDIFGTEEAAFDAIGEWFKLFPQIVAVEIITLPVVGE